MGLDTHETPKNKDFHEKTEALFSVLSDFILTVDMLYLRFNIKKDPQSRVSFALRNFFTNKKRVGLCPPYAIKRRSDMVKP